jgi:predicted 2-oxoglutarate/Fe(II)-dependent dioxygenase YbiX
MLNEFLIKNNYFVVPNFITKEKSEELFLEFKDHCNNQNLPGDSQAPNSHSQYNYISFLELLCEKTPEVSSILGETVIPTYAYSRIYKNKSELVPHTDRDACEVSLTLHLWGDRSWPIWIKTPDGVDKCVNLNPGDAMLYLGTIASHWRDPYGGEEYGQVFLHYVRSRGKCSYAYFDKSTEKTSEFVLNEEKIKNIIEENETTSIKTPELLVKKTGSRKKSLEDYIITLDSIVPEELCDRIIDEYNNSSFWTNSAVGNGYVDPTVRNCDTINISADIVINDNFDVRKKIDSDLFECAAKAISEYRTIFPEVASQIDTGYGLLRYSEGQFYIQHTDSFLHQQRTLSCSFILNDNFIGGEFAFFDKEIMIRSPKGSAILFPSNFMYPHEIMPVKSGIRYSIITWFV